ncbi:MAG TPA: ABC transporter ATP-binding protein [Phycisphaerae bacterium]|nr:ABC transporter ATP-binding protein [Phycisphaerae bacterium]HOJ74210.1 ABC transporter ATP-binding protein [Phycisphaerae bacterium]HOM51288.1 ABC transporter ATP-binding protein [Phycisphaerae bacterium]HON65839.1 ABC transporter ATP-binding protein [Phycisphaerae bacterium]HOQ84900.1 ABC transporter ATP-binding protein [Phycisphaerae bacterium]
MVHEPDTSVLSVRDLRKSYQLGERSIEVLHGINLDLRRGDLTLLMGPSGSGKTTLLTIMGLLLRPTSGQVLLLGRDVSRLDEWRLPALRRAHIGFIFQGFNLLSALTAVENVEVVLEMQGLRGRAARRRAMELLDSVGLADRWDHLPEALSGGEKQRVGVARALASPAELILADEPTGNLDSKTAAQVVDILRHLAHRENRAVLVVTHDPALRQLADQTIHMRDGLIVEDAKAKPSSELAVPLASAVQRPDPTVPLPVGVLPRAPVDPPYGKLVHHRPRE